MLSVLRNSYQRNARLSANHFVVSSVENRHLHTWWSREKFVQDKFNCGRSQHLLKLQRCDFRTTQRLYIPPIVAYLLRPVIHIGAALMGRSVKKWWTRKSNEEKEKYKQWYRENRNVLLGCFGLYGLMVFIYYVIHIKIDPVTKRSKFIIFNEEQEKDLANKLYKTQLQMFKSQIVSRNHPVYKRIRRILESLVTANSDLKSMEKIKWNVTLIDAELQNSFTLPGGNIFISLDLLKYVENNDQLGFMLAHEMAHSLLSHGLEMLSDQLLLDFLIAVPILLIWMIFPDMAAAIVHTIVDRTINIMHQLPYNRVLEKEADEVAMQLSAKACIDVREAVVFWATMRMLTEMEVLPSPVPWVSSHPSHGDREKNINNLMSRALKMRSDAGVSYSAHIVRVDIVLRASAHLADRSDVALLLYLFSFSVPNVTRDGPEDQVLRTFDEGADDPLQAKRDHRVNSPKIPRLDRTVVPGLAPAIAEYQLQQHPEGDVLFSSRASHFLRPHPNFAMVADERVTLAAV
ncbi:PREDICTED: metalloendopeptidase OMA1, mitochondrial-like isoform X2 [Dinoponera quadriceps]|uniref:Metalloendopeptidase OMA1, mitochondrial n=1 Tax=Dinoponera quadriceps TaxID=609295 RepID=A0A6P3XSQ3_DINQU|nr:PREDICTED: metalloendopeptidase OMA1, mitochondrial-like isoform X2 [Dinoponera quadriceps]